nr:MAG TPA: hypothetical protein [Caudoviricetes sp.]
MPIYLSGIQLTTIPLLVIALSTILRWILQRLAS